MTRFPLFALVLALPCASAAAIENAVCEQTGPASYRLDFRVTDAGPVTVYVSSSADRIDNPKPVAILRKAPAEVSVPGQSGRVYFHLKPENGPTRVVSTRRLPLEGAVNFRDVGGYRTIDGKYVRWGHIYRSDHLVGLTEQDYEYLSGLGIKLVCDLRADFERKRSPTAWQGEKPEFLIAPIGDDASISASMAKLKSAFDSGADPAEYLRAQRAVSNDSSYAEMLFLYREQYARVFHRLANSSDPALTHCTGGADRTGVYSALLLATLGVPRDVIVADYLLTRQNFLDEKHQEATAKNMQSILGLDRPPDQNFLRSVIGGMNSDRIETMFHAIDTKYGSFDAFLKDGLELSQTDVASLRQRLLEP
jgi:protein-tyrosine phosphatase